MTRFARYVPGAFAAASCFVSAPLGDGSFEAFLYRARMQLRLLVTFALALAACAHPTASIAPSVAAPADLASLGAPGLRAMSAGLLESNTKYLSSDALEGRGTGASGGASAEAFVAEQLAKIGFEPAGEAGTYFQTLHLREALLKPAESSLVISVGGTQLSPIPATDILIRPFARDANVRVEGKLIFAGFAIARPDLGYDDLAGVDLRGAIVIAYAGAPRVLGGKPVPSTLHAALADSAIRSQALRDRGARAVILVWDPVRAEKLPFEKFLARAPSTSTAWIEKGEPGSGVVIPAAFISEAALATVFAATKGNARPQELWAKLDRGEPVHADLGASAALRAVSSLRDMTARNVAGILRGRDPALGSEAVVYSAHLDHLGIGKPVNGDAIYNGAFDDAIGVAGVLEIGRAFAALRPRPDRSILCLLVTGEERGLLGSDYFARHPTVPIEKIVADINIDALTANYEATDMVVLGEEHSTLHDHIVRAARASGYTVSPDSNPEEGYFIRSDQYSFVKQGVPAAFPAAGYRDAHGDTAANRAISDAWEKNHYHQPSDEWRPEYNATWATKEAGFDFLIGLSVATTRERPRWNRGDVFEKR
jgi:hypothetical protein